MVKQVGNPVELGHQKQTQLVVSDASSDEADEEVRNTLCFHVTGLSGTPRSDRNLSYL